MELQLSTFEQTNKAEIISLNKRREDIRNSKEAERGNNQQIANGLDGLLERIKLCHEIAGFWISTFITMLFMVIELTPIFFKLMLTKGPYDFLEDNVKELIKAENGIYVQYNYYKDKQGQERDLITYLQSKRLIEDKISLAKAQEELSAYALAKWKEQQKRRIDEDVSQFVKTEPEESLQSAGMINLDNHEERDAVARIGR